MKSYISLAALCFGLVCSPLSAMEEATAPVASSSNEAASSNSPIHPINPTRFNITEIPALPVSPLGFEAHLALTPEYTSKPWFSAGFAIPAGLGALSLAGTVKLMRKYTPSWRTKLGAAAGCTGIALGAGCAVFFGYKAWDTLKDRLSSQRISYETGRGNNERLITQFNNNNIETNEAFLHHISRKVTDQPSEYTRLTNPYVSHAHATFSGSIQNPFVSTRNEIKQAISKEIRAHAAAIAPHMATRARLLESIRLNSLLREEFEALTRAALISKINHAEHDTLKQCIPQGGTQATLQGYKLFKIREHSVARSPYSSPRNSQEVETLIGGLRNLPLCQTEEEEQQMLAQIEANILTMQNECIDHLQGACPDEINGMITGIHNAFQDNQQAVPTVDTRHYNLSKGLMWGGIATGAAALATCAWALLQK